MDRDLKIVEGAVEAFKKDDSSTLIRIIEAEIEKSKSRGHYNVAQRLRKIVSSIPREKRMSGQSLAGTIQQSTDNALYERIESEILLDDVILDEQNRKMISGFLREWEDYDRLVQHNVYPANKLLFYGPPGTGKTKLAYAIANKLDFPLILIRLDELISSFLGKTGKNIRDIFDLARKEKVVIFMDEVDTIAKHRDDNAELGELKRVVTVLLQNIDIFPNNSIIIGATNHENLLDKAVWRRFTLKIKFDKPSKESRKSMFKLYLSKFIGNIDIELLAALTEGLTGSMIFDICMNLKKELIISDVKKPETIHAVQAITNFFSTRTGIEPDTLSKKNLYILSRILRDNGYSLVEISLMTGIPYTTLRDNIK